MCKQHEERGCLHSHHLRTLKPCVGLSALLGAWIPFSRLRSVEVTSLVLDLRGAFETNLAESLLPRQVEDKLIVCLDTFV